VALWQLPQILGYQKIARARKLSCQNIFAQKMQNVAESTPIWGKFKAKIIT